MKITRIEFAMLRVPLKTPFKTALRTVDAVEDIVVMTLSSFGPWMYTLAAGCAANDSAIAMLQAALRAATSGKSISVSAIVLM